jgi:hypothetical protein
MRKGKREKRKGKRENRIDGFSGGVGKGEECPAEAGRYKCLY